MRRVTYVLLQLIFILLISFLPIKVLAANEMAHLNSEWLALNYYVQYKGKWTSEIQNPDFFVAPDGFQNPESEFIEFRTIVLKAASDRVMREKACLYPARLSFLETILSLNFTCENTRIGTVGEVKSVSLIFANGYFGNPASYYGHVLLKLNSNEIATHTRGLLDTSVNYGARIPDNTNAFKYIFKGVFGFYRGRYQKNNFFINNVQYADNESRDIWIYDLNLSPTQSMKLHKRMVELERAEFKYYFFGDNCAHKIGDIIEQISNVDLNINKMPWMMPIQLINSVSSAQIDNHLPLVSDIRYFPASHTQFLNRIQTMSKKELTALEAILDGISLNDIDLDNTSYKSVLVAADLFLRRQLLEMENQKITDSLKIEQTKKIRQKILAELRSLRNIKESYRETSGMPPAPHTGGRNGSSIGFSHISHSEYGSAAEINFTPAYSDKLSPNIGKIHNSTLHMGKLVLIGDERNLRLKELTFFEVQNLKTAQVKQRFEPGRVWQISVGLKRMGLNPSNLLIPFVNGGIGVDFDIIKTVDAYAMASITVSEPNSLNAMIVPTLTTGVIFTPTTSSRLSIHTNLDQRRNGKIRLSSEVSLRVYLTRSVDLNFSYLDQSDNGDMLRIGMSRHF